MDHKPKWNERSKEWLKQMEMWNENITMKLKQLEVENSNNNYHEQRNKKKEEVSFAVLFLSGVK